MTRSVFIFLLLNLLAFAQQCGELEIVEVNKSPQPKSTLKGAVVRHFKVKNSSKKEQFLTVISDGECARFTEEFRIKPAATTVINVSRPVVAATVQEPLIFSSGDGSVSFSPTSTTFGEDKHYILSNLNLPKVFPYLDMRQAVFSLKFDEYKTFGADFKSYMLFDIIYLTTAEFGLLEDSVKSGLKSYVMLGGLLVIEGTLPDYWESPESHQFHSWGKALNFGFGKVLVAPKKSRELEDVLVESMYDDSDLFYFDQVDEFLLYNRQGTNVSFQLGFIYIYLLIIGPGLMIYLRLERKQYLYLFYLLPVTGAFASLFVAYPLVTGYFTGLTIVSRSVTFFDQTSQQTYTKTGLGVLNKGVIPPDFFIDKKSLISSSARLTMEDNKKVYEVEEDRVKLSKGWIEQNENINFELNSVKPVKEGLIIKRLSDSEIRVANHFSQPLAQFHICDKNGQIYHFDEVLNPTESVVISSDEEQIAKTAFTFTKIMKADDQFEFDQRPTYWLAEKSLHLPRRRYLAEFIGNSPFMDRVEIGGEERHSAIVYGVFKESE